MRSAICLAMVWCPQTRSGLSARMLARRVLRMRDELAISVPLSELASHHLEVNMGGQLNKQTKEGLLTILARGRALC